MTVQFKVDWDSAHLSGATYTLGTPEVPNGYTLTFDATAAITTGAWGGSRTIATIPNFSAKVYDNTWDVTIPTNPQSFRFLLEAEYTNTERELLLYFFASTDNFLRVNTSGTNPRIYVRWATGGSDADIVLAYTIVEDTPFVIEVIIDTNNGTAANRLKARAWAVGGSAGSFETADATSGAAGIMPDFTTMQLGDGGGGTQNSRIGRFIISDDIGEDLSALLGGGGGATGPAIGARYLIGPWVR